MSRKRKVCVICRRKTAYYTLAGAPPVPHCSACMSWLERLYPKLMTEAKLLACQYPLTRANGEQGELEV